MGQIYGFSTWGVKKMVKSKSTAVNQKWNRDCPAVGLRQVNQDGIGVRATASL